MENVENKIPIWENKDKNGNPYWDVTIGSKKFSIFPNKYWKEGEKKPKYNLLIQTVGQAQAKVQEEGLPF